jgi:hypothetical protein
VIAEGNETPGGESGGAPEGRRPLSEGDILAERRARRAAESGEHALTLRAEAAESTVRTLETHVTSLQQQLQESEAEGRRLAERIDTAPPPQREQHPEHAERAYAPPRDAVLERELRRASQREYAEQRLRIEAEDRSGQVERETRTELDRLGRRLEVSERDAQTLGVRLETAQRELAEAEQALAAQRAAVVRSERELRVRLSELERQADQLHSGLETERSARERAEQMLAALQQAQRGAQLLLAGLADTVARLREAALRPRETSAPARAAPAPAMSLQSVSPPTATPPSIPASDIPLADVSPQLSWHPPAPRAPEPPAIAPAATPAAAVAPSAPAPAAPRPPAPERAALAGETSGGEMAVALAEAVERLRARVEQQAVALQPPVAKAPPHKHAMSLIARIRLAARRRSEQRKQRRSA